MTHLRSLRQDTHSSGARTLVIVAVLLSAAASIAAQAGETHARRLKAVHITGLIVVDGRLDEPDWHGAEVATGFVQNDPHEGTPASERTDVRVLYDERTLYVGAFAHYRNPEDIVVNELKRDFDGTSTDWMAVIVDTFHDRRNGYQFGVNPGGAMWDSQKFNEGRERNLSWDGAWTVRTSRSPEGWYAEFAIPFTVLQVPRSDPQTWGINFQRHLQKRLENSFWSPIPRQYVLDRLSLAGTLEGLEGLKRGINLRVKPYALARSTPDGAASTERAFNAGADVKYGITPGLTADFSVNTDFSQVESDIQQVGATRFSVRLPEKREFFLENSGVFQFGPGSDHAALISAAPGASAGGRDNSVQNDLTLFFSRRIGLSESGTVLPLHAGVRLTGRVAKTTIGALHVRQGSEDDEAGAAFTALRVRHNVGPSSDVGAAFLERRDGTNANRVVGVDANARPIADLLVYGYAAKTLDSAPPVSGRTTAARAGATWLDGSWAADASWGSIGAGFEDELGFVPRTGIVRRQALLGRHFRPRTLSRWVRDLYGAAGVSDVRREGGGFDSRYGDYRLLLTFEDGATVELGANQNEEDLATPFEVDPRRGIAVPVGRYTFTDRFIAIASSRSKPLVIEARASTGGYYDGDRHLLQLVGSARLNARLSGSVSVTRDQVQLPTAGATSHLLTARANVGFSTRALVNALVQYSSATGRWDTNVRFNWIHRPLSDLFIVFSEGREPQAGMSGTHPGRTVTVKLTRLVSF